ncbi:hypothetical protein NDU88_006494 [Pleurodeles waltl]|uniref:Uncharacterized protein n=1 Tax=Pleurodeles waltl TaxID=8319 RepID=A0AAV7QM42_PLEWA|nr:hypothetical protein NDU88_006494 [Pleurodeles waltl]
MFQTSNNSMAAISPPTRNEGLKFKFIKLERLRKQELSRWWDYTTLLRYIDNKQIPRGLRIILFPSFEDLCPDLLKEWEQLLITSSYSMMDILIRDARMKTDKLLADIVTLEKEIGDINLPEAKVKNYEILKDVIRKHHDYIKDKKTWKLRRDDNDYKNGRVFTFARKFDNIKTDKSEGVTHINTTNTVSVASTSDTERSSASSMTDRDWGTTSQKTSVPMGHKSSFLLELERFRKGQKLNRQREEAPTNLH